MVGLLGWEKGIVGKEPPPQEPRDGDRSDGDRAAEYPYPAIVPIPQFEKAADTLGLCRQERRVTMGRVLHYSLGDIAIRLELSPHTVKQYDDRARRRAHCADCGELVRRVLALAFSA